MEIDVLANDSDPDGTLEPSTVTVATPPSSGSTSVDGTTGAITFTPPADASGTFTFGYTVDDDGGATSNEATVTVTVAPVNDAPDAVDDTGSTDEDASVNVDVLNNDTDPEGDDLSVTGVGDPGSGTATLESDETITYAPDADFNGADSFTYTVSDGNGGTDQATVTITVGAVNDAPVATDDAATTNENASVLVDVMDNDSDVDGDDLTITNVTDPANGSTAMESGQVRYTPDTDYTGTDTFSYTVSDGNGGTDQATVTMTINAVNDAPVAVDDDASTAEDTAVNIDVLDNDSDPDGDVLTITDVTAPADGTAMTETDGTITYTPDADFNGTDSFTYTVSDGNGGSDQATVTVTVDAVNDAPVAEDDAAATNENTSVVVDVLDNDRDADGDALTITDVSAPSDGTAAIESGQIRYEPDADFSGSDSFTYTISDGNGGTDQGTVSITVAAVNASPTANSDNATVDEDASVSIAVLDNDSDADDDVLTISSVTEPANGTATAETDGTITYAPAADFNGTDTFSYTVSDGNGGSDEATVTVTVTAVNDAPVAGDDALTTMQGEAVVGDVLANDSDVDGDALTISSVTEPANGTATIEANQVRYEPESDFVGTDTFDYTIEDGNGGTDVGTVTVTVRDTPNEVPVAEDDAATTSEDEPVVVDVLANDSDADNDGLTISSVTEPANGTATAETDGTITYAPAADFNGTDTFTYTVSDGNGGSDEATVTVTVTAVNDAPVAADDAATTVEGESVEIDVLANDSDVDGTLDASTVTIASAPSSGTANVDDATGTITYVAPADQGGVFSFTYTVDDDQGATSNAATVTVEVGAVNDAPVAEDDEATTVQNESVEIDVLANDSDPDGDALTVSSVSEPLNGTATIEEGVVLYTPNDGFVGNDLFTYVVGDGNAASDEATVTVAVTEPANQAPTAEDDDASTEKEEPVVIDVLANDTDPEGDALTIASVAQPLNGTATIEEGQVRYVPAAGFVGTDTFTYTITDGNGGSDEATVTVETVVGDAVDGEDGVPERFVVDGNYPNPFNPSTTIVFDLHKAATVSVDIFDLLGRPVKHVAARSFSAGSGHTIRIDAAELGSGTYVYRIEAHMGETVRSASGRMVLLK